jgi:hypothetical protein
MSSLPVDGGSGPVESSFPPSREEGRGKPVPRWARYEDEVDEEEEASEEALGLRREGADAPDEKEGTDESRDPESTSLPPQPWGDETHETKLMAGGGATGWGLADTGAKGEGLLPHHPSESLLRVTSPLRVPSPGTGPPPVPRLQFHVQPDTTTSGNDEGTLDHSSGNHSNGDLRGDNMNWPPDPHVGLGTDASRQGLPSPRFFALEMFDDQDDLEKDAHDFERRLSERAREMAAAPGAAVSAAAVSAANAADQRPFLPAQSTWNHLSGDREWRHCDVLEMDASSQRYLIRWRHNGKMKYVSRFNIIFDHEDRPTLDARTRRAKARREASEARSRYHFNLTALAQGMDLTEWAVPAEMMIAVLHRSKVDIGSLGLPIALSGEGDHPNTSLDAPLSSWSVGSERRPSATLGGRSLGEEGGRESSRPLATAASTAASTEADAAYIEAVLELTEEVRHMYIHDLQLLELQELVDSDDRYRGPRMAPPVRGLPTHRVLSRGGLSALRDALLLATPCDSEALIARGCRVASRLPIADPLVLKAMHLCSDVMERIRSMVHFLNVYMTYICRTAVLCFILKYDAVVLRTFLLFISALTIPLFLLRINHFSPLQVYLVGGSTADMPGGPPHPAASCDNVKTTRKMRRQRGRGALAKVVYHLFPPAPTAAAFRDKDGDSGDEDSTAAAGEGGSTAGSAAGAEGGDRPYTGDSNTAGSGDEGSFDERPQSPWSATSSATSSRPGSPVESPRAAMAAAGGREGWEDGGGGTAAATLDLDGVDWLARWRMGETREEQKEEKAQGARGVGGDGAFFPASLDMFQQRQAAQYTLALDQIRGQLRTTIQNALVDSYDDACREWEDLARGRAGRELALASNLLSTVEGETSISNILQGGAGAGGSSTIMMSSVGGDSFASTSIPSTFTAGPSFAGHGPALGASVSGALADAAFIGGIGAADRMDMAGTMDAYLSYRRRVQWQHSVVSAIARRQASGARIDGPHPVVPRPDKKQYVRALAVVNNQVREALREMSVAAVKDFVRLFERYDILSCIQCAATGGRDDGNAVTDRAKVALSRLCWGLPVESDATRRYEWLIRDVFLPSEDEDEGENGGGAGTNNKTRSNTGAALQNLRLGAGGERSPTLEAWALEEGVGLEEGPRNVQAKNAWSGSDSSAAEKAGGGLGERAAEKARRSASCGWTRDDTPEGLHPAVPDWMVLERVAAVEQLLRTQAYANDSTEGVAVPEGSGVEEKAGGGGGGGRGGGLKKR